MTKSQMFKEAHAGAREDVIWAKANIAKVGAVHPHSYYFRLHLIGMQEDAAPKRTGFRPMSDGLVRHLESMGAD